MKKIYLASPYSAESELVEQHRYESVCGMAGRLIQTGYVVFSPIAHSHGIARQCPDLDGRWDAWKTQDFALIDWCDEVWVAEMAGWNVSQGVREEVVYAQDTKPVWLLNLDHVDGHSFFRRPLSYDKGIHAYSIGDRAHMETPQRDSADRQGPAAIDAAKAIVDGHKRDRGDIGENCDKIAADWSLYLDGQLTRPLTGRQFAWLMVRLKSLRDSWQPERDNLIDAHGYVIGAERAGATRIGRKEV